MGGLAVLFVVGLYLAIGLWIVVKSPGWWRFVALLAVIFIPTADALWGRYVTLPRLCKDAGLQVNAKASRDGGLLLEGPPDEALMLKYGFPFIEGRDAAGKYHRISKQVGEDRIVFDKDVRPQARYAFRAVNTAANSNFPGSSLIVEDRKSGTVFGRVDAFTFVGGWSERLLAKFTDAGVSGVDGCGWDNYQVDKLFRAAFTS